MEPHASHETACLTRLAYREEFNMGFVAMFAALTFVKVFHWLVQVRGHCQHLLGEMPVHRQVRRALH